MKGERWYCKGLHVVDSMGNEVATARYGKQSYAERTKNAQLIAESPAMEEALKNILECASIEEAKRIAEETLRR